MPDLSCPGGLDRSAQRPIYSFLAIHRNVIVVSLLKCTAIFMAVLGFGLFHNYATARSRASNPEKRRSVRLFRTAIARALPCPTSTTSRFPRVTPV